MKKRQLNLQFPLGGLNRRYGFQKQAPFTTPDCLNVRPTDTIQNRDRGGSRPGLVAAYPQLLGNGAPIRMLSNVTVVQSDGLKYVEDDFTGTVLGSQWSAATWISASLPSIFPGNLSDVQYNTAAGAIWSLLTDINTSLPYQVELEVVPYNGQHNGKYQLFANMNNTTPLATTDGIVAELVLNDALGTYSGTLKTYANSVLTNTFAFAGGATGAAEVGTFSMLVNGTAVTCSWKGIQLTSQTVPAAVGSRFGFGMNCTVAGGVCLADFFRCQYQSNTNNQALRRILVASSNGSVYRETFVGTMAVSTTALSLNKDYRQLTGVESAQKLYIADNGNPIGFGTAGTIALTNQLSDPAVANWASLFIGFNIADHVCILSNTLSGTVAQTFPITSTSTGHITLGNTPDGNAPGNGTCSWRIERAVKVYDPIADTLTVLTASNTTQLNGQVPAGCPLAALYRGRLVLAGQPIAPQAWFMSRQGDPTDWNYAALSTDGGRAVAGASSLAGVVGDALTALIAHGDDYLVFGCASTIWVLYGDPALGGQINNLSRTVGVVSKSAWCRGPSGELVFLSRDGLYALTPSPYGGLMPPQSISRELLPKELLNLDPTVYTISMEYDVKDRGVHIFLTPTLGASGRTHWFVDWRTRSFWPVTANGNYDAFCTTYYVGTDAKNSAVLLGCRDGYIRRFHDNQETDSGTAFSSYVLYGPVRLGGDDYTDGLIYELIGMVGAQSGAVNWAVITGNESEDIGATTTAAKSGTFSRASLNLKARPRARGGSLLVKISNGATRRWAMESLVAIAGSTTQQRLST